MLKEQLGDLYTPEIEAKLNGKEFIEKDDNMIPKSRLDQVISQKKELETQIKEHETSLAELKKVAGSNDELTKKISDLQEQNKKSEELRIETTKKLEKEFKIRDSLRDAGVNDKDAIDVLLPKFDKVQFDDGKLIGFDDIVNPLKENKSFSGMFGETKIVGKAPDKNKEPEKGANFITYAEYAAMPRSQRQSPEIQKKVEESRHKWE